MKLNLRIRRTWHWVAEPFTMHTPIGGRANLRLEHTCVFETWDPMANSPNGEWVPVEIIDDPKPEHPDEVCRREEHDRVVKEIAAFFKAQKEPTHIDILKGMNDA
jgi:hypothetical protein